MPMIAVSDLPSSATRRDGVGRELPSDDLCDRASAPSPVKLLSNAKIKSAGLGGTKARSLLSAIAACRSCPTVICLVSAARRTSGEGRQANAFRRRSAAPASTTSFRAAAARSAAARSVAPASTTSCRAAAATSATGRIATAASGATGRVAARAGIGEHQYRNEGEEQRD